MYIIYILYIFFFLLNINKKIILGEKKLSDKNKQLIVLAQKDHW